jgi:uncharacterized protein DUF4407
MLSRALRYPSLRPYGDSLLTPAGAFWIFAVRLAVVLMASAEAFGWSYAAFYMALGNLRWAAGAAAFVFTFITVCLIDASLMTLDRWSLTNDHRLTGEAPPDRSTRMRDLLSISTRIALVALSMYITAPFLAQLMFKSDIERALHDERVEIRGSARQSLLAPIDARLESLNASLDRRRPALDAEVAGGGRSGRYGDGPAARQLRATVGSLERERAALTTERARVAAEFDALSDQALAERYKLALPGDSFQERSRALAKSRNETYLVTERAVQAFLAFLFAALLLLKLFEPRSVSIYFSERLQALYRQYLGGLFDAQIEPAERSAGSAPMTPLRFEDWCLSTYPSLREREAEAVKASARAQFFAASVSELSAITASAVAEETALIEQLAAVEMRLQQVAVDLGGAKRTLASAHAKLEEHKTYRTTLETGLKRPGSPEALTAILTTISELEAATVSLASEKAAALTRLDTLEPMLADLEQRRADLTARIDRLADVRQRAETDLAAARVKHMTELSRAIEQRWATPVQEQEPAPAVAPLPAVIDSSVDRSQSRVH